VDDMLLAGLTDEWAATKVVMGRAGLISYNATISALFALARAGACERVKIPGGWSWRKVPEVPVDPHDVFRVPPEWDPSCGSLKNVWDRKSVYGSGGPPNPGSRVAWAFRWLDVGARVLDEAGHYRTLPGAFPAPAVEDMEPREIVAELADYAARGVTGAGQCLALLESLPWETAMNDVGPWLRDHGRMGRPEAVGAWMLGGLQGGMIMALSIPRGWMPRLPDGEKLVKARGGGWVIVDDADRVVRRLSEKIHLSLVTDVEKREARQAVRRANAVRW